ncbi:type VI secretion system tube protein TssD [Spirosoma sp.]|uniref:type VI secretion system tube protein TssD n=1 Tax=Spirosoma sp. TaxID=1899569 RepID=UPI002612C02E|nr:type VI secretion system tube protein TssD [Spirosoma sp.]MCX6216955.1 type VI secretion system tube protein TssD [Spirosoma sp.]
MAASFSAEFILPDAGASFRVLTCDYQLSQMTDQRGRPTAGVRSGLLRIAIMGANYQSLTHWAIDPFKAHDGSIVFKDLVGKTFKTITFTQGYCVSYREIFTPHDGEAVVYRFDLGITAAQVTLLGDTLHDNQWLDWKFGNR